VTREVKLFLFSAMVSRVGVGGEENRECKREKSFTRLSLVVRWPRETIFQL